MHCQRCVDFGARPKLVLGLHVPSPAYKAR